MTLNDDIIQQLLEETKNVFKAHERRKFTKLKKKILSLGSKFNIFYFQLQMVYFQGILTMS